MIKKKRFKRTIKKSSARKIPKRSVQGLSKAETNKIKRIKIRIVGVGGGGSSIVSEIASKIIRFSKKKISFVVANTDLQALRRLAKEANRFQFGQDLTRGLGTGMNVELGREAAQREKEKIKKIFESQDLCILVACLGGGTSSGASPIFAEISRRLGNINFGIFTLPFKFEGEKKMEIAKESLEKLKPNLNAFLIIPNERIFQIIDKEAPLREALSGINKNLIEGLKGLLEIIYLPGLINIDFADFKTILRGKGRLAYLNSIEIEKTDQGDRTIKKLLFSPLYPYTIRGAKRILFNICGEKNLSLETVSQISKSIYQLAKGEAKIIFGVSQGKRYKDKIKITLLATGCKTKIFPKKKPRLKEVVIKKKLQKKKKKQTLAKKPETKQPKPEVKTPVAKEKKVKVKVRKNALQVKKTIKEAEKEILEKEKTWETPAFLRRKTIPGSK
ncbi:cell division FtsZ family protein [Patescibacteria group bacterium]|nr:cell division FtsZ family protein [Patescibacteria group bacterium]